MIGLRTIVTSLLTIWHRIQGGVFNEDFKKPQYTKKR